MNRKVYRMIPRAGNMDNLTMQVEALPAPSEDEVTINVKAIGLNFADIFALFGLYSATPEGSFIPGLEFAGEIIATGKNVRTLKKGDCVMGVTRFGGYTDRLNVDYHYVVPLPGDWSYHEGAGFLVHALTAYYALIVLADIRQNQTVLIHSAAGGVGILANRIAKKFDAYTIGTIGSERKIDVLKNEGYDDWIVRSDHFREDLRNKLGKRELDIVLESIGGKIFRDGFRLLAPEGRMIIYGSSSFTTPGRKPDYFKMFWKWWKRPKVDPMRMVEWNKSIMGFNLIHLYHKKERMEQYTGHINELDIGKPVIRHVYDFEHLLDGVRHLQTGKTTGKVVIEVK